MLSLLHFYISTSLSDIGKNTAVSVPLLDLQSVIHQITEKFQGGKKKKKQLQSNPKYFAGTARDETREFRQTYLSNSFLPNFSKTVLPLVGKKAS